MQYESGNIWDIAEKNSGFVVVTTNTCIRTDGKAVMGGGIALDAATRYPILPTILGKHIKILNEQLYMHFPIICFPTKTNWQLPSDIKLIERGCIQLHMFGEVLNQLQVSTKVYLPKLGCGLGGLHWEKTVRPVVDSILATNRFVLVTQ